MKQLLIWIVLALTLAGCTNLALQTQLHTASAVAIGANTALPVLLDHYRAAGASIIAQSEDRVTAERRLDGLKSSWAPVWLAWDSLASAHAAWVATLVSNGDLSKALEAFKAAYCDLKATWPMDIPALPMVPVTCTEKNPKT